MMAHGNLNEKFTERQGAHEQNSPTLVLSTSNMLLSHLCPFLDFFFSLWLSCKLFHGHQTLLLSKWETGKQIQFFPPSLTLKELNRSL